MSKAPLDMTDLARRLASDPEYVAEARLTIPAEPVSPDPLRRLARDLSIKFHDYYCLPECRGHNAPGAMVEYGEDVLLEVLERVVRETAMPAREGGIIGALRHWGLDPESQP